MSVVGRMEEMLSDLMEFFVKPSITKTSVDILLCAVPIWLAVMIGLVIGWSWRPRWTGFPYLGLRSKFRLLRPRRWGSALSAFSLCRTIWSNFKGKGKVAPPFAGDSAASGSAATAESCTDIVGCVSSCIRSIIYDDGFLIIFGIENWFIVPLRKSCVDVAELIFHCTGRLSPQMPDFSVFHDPCPIKEDNKEKLFDLKKHCRVRV